MNQHLESGANCVRKARRQIRRVSISGEVLETDDKARTKRERAAFVLTKTIEGETIQSGVVGCADAEPGAVLNSRFWNTQNANRFLNHERRDRAVPRRPGSTLMSARPKVNRDECAVKLRKQHSAIQRRRHGS
ncbi:hypothetical protein EVAR_28796_1 [Eumeta japonica]|uniref:Uncharacterized protein n=1 Tax=Eumeta variegata TaxID=151549 RepID=A0A4C1VFZ8_EUMVA|nr:hypothetical protein EVAR_28796_1 [Eumeta japonica]